MSCGSSEAYITVFKSAPPGENTEGPRIWNDQLLQYAAYSDGGEVTGDPKNVRKSKGWHLACECYVLVLTYQYTLVIISA